MSSTNNPDLADTGEMPILENKHVAASAGRGRVRVDCAARSDIGKVRANNEDHFLAARFGRFLEPLLTNLSGKLETMFEEEGHGMVVADGMGGAAAGEVASSLAIHTLLNLIFDTPDWIISSDERHAEQIMQRMAERFRQIDEQLIEKADREPSLRGMGTTMTLACNVGDSLVLAHIGDSRAYLYRAGKLHQLTHDHTVAQALVDNGILTRADLACVRLQHALVRVLGGNGHQCEAEMQRLLLLDGDVIVLCTDGLTGMVDDADIAAILGTNAAVSDACQALIDRALHNGGKDNVTAIVARYAFFDRAPSPSAKRGV